MHTPRNLAILALASVGLAACFPDAGRDRITADNGYTVYYVDQFADGESLAPKGDVAIRKLYDANQDGSLNSAEFARMEADLGPATPQPHAGDEVNPTHRSPNFYPPTN